MISLAQLEDMFARMKTRSLHERNQQLHALAERFGIESYDGMDVGPA
jgi:hypothetical protein